MGPSTQHETRPRARPPPPPCFAPRSRLCRSGQIGPNGPQQSTSGAHYSAHPSGHGRRPSDRRVRISRRVETLLRSHPSRRRYPSPATPLPRVAHFPHKTTNRATVRRPATPIALRSVDGTGQHASAHRCGRPVLHTPLLYTTRPLLATPRGPGATMTNLLSTLVKNVGLGGSSTASHAPPLPHRGGRDRPRADS